MNGHRSWMVPVLVLVTAIVAQSTPVGAAFSAYTTSIAISPSRGLQTRTIEIRPDRLECWAIAHVRSDLRNVPCYDVVTLQLSSKPKIGRWTERYASIRQCVARLTPAQLRHGCARTITECVNASPSTCPPAWTAQTSIGFRTDGRIAQKSWITCGIGSSSRFQYHLTWCNTAHGLPPTQQRWLSAGDDYVVSIRRVVQVGTAERILLRPDGGLEYSACC